MSTALAAALFTTACAQQVNTADKAAIEKIVKDYLVENPEVIEEALIALSEKQQRLEEETARAAVAANAKALFNDKRDYSIGPADADVTLVEFFDYRCGPCRGAATYVNALPAAQNGKVRVIFKEFPILSPESRQAALAALAAGEQGKYPEIHRAFMKDRGKFTDPEIDRIAKSVGVDVKKMRADMKSEALQKVLADNYELAKSVGANATPTFVIEGELFAGFDKDRIESLIKQGLGS